MVMMMMIVCLFLSLLLACATFVPTAAQCLPSFSVNPHAQCIADFRVMRRSAPPPRAFAHTPGPCPSEVRQLMRMMMLMMTSAAAAESGSLRHLECGRGRVSAQGARPRDVGDLAAWMDVDDASSVVPIRSVWLISDAVHAAHTNDEQKISVNRRRRSPAVDCCYCCPSPPSWQHLVGHLPLQVMAKHSHMDNDC